MSKLNVVALICPDCQNPLAGLRNDKVFFCKVCQKGYAWTEDKWKRYPLFYPLIKENPPVRPLYMPFWRLSVHSEVANATSRQQVAARVLPSIKHVWVNAFTIIRASYFGDVGLTYTEKGIDYQIAEIKPGGFNLAGCARGIDEATRYANLFVTLILDKKSDVTGMDINVQVTGASLWAMPMMDMGDKLVDYATGIEMPVFAIDDLEDMRRINFRR